MGPSRPLEKSVGPTVQVYILREFISCLKVEEFNDKDQIQFWCKFIVVPRLLITTGGSSFSVQAKPC